MTRIVIQKGHCYRKTGSTGTGGHRGTEQQFVDQLGDRMWEILHAAGVDVTIVLADEMIPDCDVFVALHQDGSTDATARGASVGYPPTNNAGRELGQLWKALYQQAGWPSGFRPDNYTPALSGYYAYRRVNADAKLLIEHGFATNRYDADWMWDNLDTIAAVSADTLITFTGHTSHNEDNTEMQIITDPEADRQWAVWTFNGTTIVREYHKPRPGAGDNMPGISYIIDQQIAAGTITEASR